MATSYPDDFFDGRAVRPTVLSVDHEIADLHRGSVYVEAGCLTLSGTLQGSLTIKSGAAVRISGTQQGSAHVESGAEVLVTGTLNGSTSVAVGATVVVEEGGRLAGSLRNHGTVIIRGTFGGARSGPGELRLERNGSIKQPTIRNGINFYEW